MGYRLRMLRELVAGIRPRHGEENWDAERFRGPPARHDRRCAPAPAAVLRTLALSSRLARTWGLLDDPESRDLFVDLMAYRALGWRRKRLPTNDPGRLALLETARRLPAADDAPEDEPDGEPGRRLRVRDLAPIGRRIRAVAPPRGIASAFLWGHYRFERAGHVVRPLPGDHVVDAGGGVGETALFFADEVGAEGRVHTFEFEPRNLRAIERNRSLNPELSGRIDVLPCALGDRRGAQLWLVGAGGSARVTAVRPQGDALAIRAETLDGLVEDGRIPRVDFVKMDIEGAETAALRGAARTIARFRPRLAISLYHRLSDFWEIPEFVRSLGLGYRFRLGHFSIHREETVLFAAAPPA